MKIEKISDHQIRCTLTKEDLEDREIKITELAYGTEKAKTLFRDMMEQASYEFGFEAEDIPLMIEAIPFSDSIVLLITKVEDPEELDTRFSKFGPSVRENEDSFGDDYEDDDYSPADGILDFFRKIQEAQNALASQTKSGGGAVKGEAKRKEVPNITLDETPVITRVFGFESLDDVIGLAHVLAGFYCGPNKLYKDTRGDRYALILNQGHHSPEEFNKVCNIVSEYGREMPSSAANTSFITEHCREVISSEAILTLSDM